VVIRKEIEPEVHNADSSRALEISAPMMNGHGKSDSSEVPAKSPNKAEGPAAEAMEGRELAKGNLPECNALRTQGRDGAPSALERVRQAASKDRKQRLTALLHHIYEVERLRAVYLGIKKGAAAGVDGETWEHYGEELEANLQDLSHRLKRGAYRARPVRRVYIPKVGKPGELRPLGVPALEDKIVQRATVEVLNAIYEQDFLGFSYGFRPGRSPHQALDALAVGIGTRKVNVSSSGGFRRLAFVILILLCAWACTPKVGAGCGNSARPDLWRGL
jgi:RNA-directed DNA polymerase